MSTFKEAIGNEMKEAGRAAAANLEGRAGEYRRSDAAPAVSQTNVTVNPHEVSEARQHAHDAQQDHHAAAHADYEAQREQQAAEAQQHEMEQEGPEYGD